MSAHHSSPRKVSIIHSPHKAIDGGFLAAIMLVGLVSAWPIYRTPWFFLTAGVGLAVGFTIAWWGLTRRFSWWQYVLMILGAYALLGLPLGYPEVLSSSRDLPTFFVRTARAPVTAWKDILTLDLPVGTYQAVLAPLLLLCIAVPVVSLALAWRLETYWPVAIPVSMSIGFFGIMCGSSELWGSATISGWTVDGLWQILSGLAAIVLAILWMSWRRWRARKSSLNSGRTIHQVLQKTSRRRVMPAIRGVAMLGIAMLISLLVVPTMMGGRVREVARTQVVPDILRAHEIAPLSQYRDFFRNEIYDEVQFTVTSAESRVRIAAMDYYDGVTAQVLSPSTSRDSQSVFRRVPSTLAVTGTPVDSTVSIGSLTGSWLPLVGELSSIRFEGSDATALQDNFFYDRTTLTGIQLAGVGSEGASYTLSSVPAAADGDASEISPARSNSTWDTGTSEVVPESLIDWLDLQGVPATGAGLEQAISSLRARGYLSHGLLSPEEGETFEWLDELGGEGQFQSSRAGHSTSRIDSLFTTLLDRERANPGADDADLVAAVGDDEQFALASAMIADQFGFNVRIVLGARLTSEEPDLSVCTDGVCTGGDMAAWIEVEDGTSGEWVAIDVTPQHTNAVHVDTQQQTDPKNNTEVDPDRAEVVPPPDANQGDGSKEGTDQQGSQGSPLRLSEPVRMGGVFLSAAMLLALPCAAILVRKWLRRRGRRLATYPAVRVVGAWDEFLDLARDVDMPISPQKTRMEIVRDVAPGHPQAEALAALADSAVFSPAYVSPDHAVYAWNLVHAEEKLLRHPENWWKRVRSWLSLRSLYRERATSVMQKRGRQRRVTSARHKTVRISHTTGLLASTSTRGS